MNHTDAEAPPSYVSYIRKIVAQGGPALSDYQPLETWLSDVHARMIRGEINGSQLAGLREELGDVLSLETMMGFAYLKPHGYPGDFEIIDRIYTEHRTKVGRLEAWDDYWHSHPASKAVRNRKRYFHRLMDKHTRTRTSHLPVGILNVASGPGRCIYEWLEANPTADVRIDCVEIDRKAIDYARRLNHKHAARTEFIQRNALRYDPKGTYDLIWSAGLFDYFEDEIFCRPLKRLLLGLACNGELVIGNFANTDRGRAFEAIFCDWNLKHRSKDQLRQLAMSCGIESSRIEIGQEEEGVNLFLHISGE
jgi:extracellular factor (EF) 3-hydroxypalmitic acid methyl ester biosynthesis protein